MRDSDWASEVRLDRLVGKYRVLFIAGILIAVMSATRVWSYDRGNTLVVRSAFLPVPNTENDVNDQADFEPAMPDVVLHEFIMLPGWVKQSEFDALRGWLLEQGFHIKQAQGPSAWQTYPLIKFSGTVAQVDRAFQASVMRRRGAVGGCYTVFANLLMPARFAPKGETYIQGYAFGRDSIPGLETQCGGPR
jgi:hypothetical protein